MVRRKVLRGTFPDVRQNPLISWLLCTPEKVNHKSGVCVQLEVSGSQLRFKDIDISTLDLGASDA